MAQGPRLSTNIQLLLLLWCRITVLFLPMKSFILCSAFGLAVLFLSLAPAKPQTSSTPSSADGQIHLNQIQVIGTHNSYHSGIAPNEAKLWAQRNPKLLAALDYHHAPLADQLSAGVRQIELDVFYDPQGGLYANPVGPRLVQEAGLPADPPFDPQGTMKQPGFKVMHVQDVDYRSTCQTFVACLQVVRDWSHAHPAHVPIFILVETKEDTPQRGSLPLTVARHFTPAAFDALDAEIRSMFPPAELITPDLVRGSHQTLNEAVREGGWPTLAQSRGKIGFLMDQKKVGPMYLQGHPSLRGRVIFTNADPGAPDAAFVEENDGTAAEISALVKQGYLIRTRADADTKEARANDTARREAALSSGAQLVSTDYPASEPASWNGYKVELPNNVAARCNPVLKVPACVDAQLEPATD
jgi:hypothetical protein